MNEKRIRRLMRLMGLMLIYQAPNTSTPAKGHKTYPYLLRGLRVDPGDAGICCDAARSKRQRSQGMTGCVIWCGVRLGFLHRTNTTLHPEAEKTRCRMIKCILI